MPVYVRLEGGAVRNLVLRNVRCVPAFAFTLLSVTQLWEEQKIDSLFADVRSLKLPAEAGGEEAGRVPYARGMRLPTLHLVSSAGVAGSASSNSAAAASPEPTAGAVAAAKGCEGGG